LAQDFVFLFESQVFLLKHAELAMSAFINTIWMAPVANLAAPQFAEQSARDVVLPTQLRLGLSAG
jgi:hypothetical protein